MTALVHALKYDEMMTALVHVLKYDVVGVRSVCSTVHRIPHLREYARRLASAKALEMLLKRQYLWNIKSWLTPSWRTPYCELMDLQSRFRSDIEGSEQIFLHAGFDKYVILPHTIQDLPDPFLPANPIIDQSTFKYQYRWTKGGIRLYVLIG